MRRRFLILHGWQGSGPDHWQTWLAGRLEARGERVQYPALPDPDTPVPGAWGSALHDELAALAGADGERVVVCHSLGGVVWLREAAGVVPEHRVDRVVLVAPPCPAGVPAALQGFFPVDTGPGAVAAAAGATRIVCADADPYCPEGAATRWARPLRLPLDLVPGGGHLNPDAGLGPWPAMEAWCLGERGALEGHRDGELAQSGEPASRDQ
jgi:predicted alpha/beta hydrolase family esterase